MVALDMGDLERDEDDGREEIVTGEDDGGVCEEVEDDVALRGRGVGEFDAE